MRNTYCWAWVNAELFVKHTLKKIMDRVWFPYNVNLGIVLVFAARCYAQGGLCRRAVSVCLSVSIVDCVKTSKHIFNFFSPSLSQAILVFAYQSLWRYPDGNPGNGGVEYKGYEKLRFSKNISLCLGNGKSSACVYCFLEHQNVTDGWTDRIATIRYDTIYDTIPVQDGTTLFLCETE